MGRCTCWPCWPARRSHWATMRLSRPKAAMMAWVGQPWHSKVRTIVTRSPRLQAIEGRPLGGREGVAAGLAPRALPPLAMHADAPLPHASSSWALGVVAAWALRVHWWPPLDTILPSYAITSGRMPEGPAVFQATRHSPRPTGVIPDEMRSRFFHSRTTDDSSTHY
jgi:hypothetical protein